MRSTLFQNVAQYETKEMYCSQQYHPYKLASLGSNASCWHQSAIFSFRTISSGTYQRVKCNIVQNGNSNFYIFYFSFYCFFRLPLQFEMQNIIMQSICQIGASACTFIVKTTEKRRLWFWNFFVIGIPSQQINNLFRDSLCDLSIIPSATVASMPRNASMPLCTAVTCFWKCETDGVEYSVDYINYISVTGYALWLPPTAFSSLSQQTHHRFQRLHRANWKCP